MKAIVYTGTRSVQVVDDWPEPVCGPDEVVVRMRAVGLCGSDLSIYDGHRSVPSLPWLMGHEGGGDVEQVGALVTDRTVGQRVVIEPNLACTTCEACRSGVTSACPARRILGMNAPGVLAERVAVPAAFTLPVPAAWPDQLLASFEPLAVARAAVRRSGVRPGQRCLVVGAGSQGLLLCLALQALGAEAFVTEPHEGRLAMAVGLGASRVDPDGPGFPHVFETAGVPAAFATALHAVASTGTVTLIGLGHEPVPLSTDDVVRRGLTLTGSIIYDHPQDFEQTRHAVAHGLQPQRAALAGTAPARAGEAFAGARDLPGKSWIDLTQGWGPS